MSIQVKVDIGYTSGSIKFYERYKEAFGEVISAEMVANPEEIDYTLTLKNKYDEELVFCGGLTSGYSGEGCRGTKKVLKLAGFEVTDEFISNNVSFKLTK